MTMDEDVHFPEYRAPEGCMGGLAVPSLGLVGIMGGLAQLSRGGAPLWLLLGLPAVLLLLFLLMRIAAGRIATLTGPDGITVKRPFGARSTAWPDIQAIEVQSDPSAVVDTGVIAEHVVLYDRDGRQMLLPHINSKTVFALNEDVVELRALWERLRGKDWVALPEVVEKMARTRRRMNGQRAVLAGVAAWGGVMVVGLVLFLVLLLTGALDGIEESTPALGAVALAVVGVVVGVMFGRRVARKGEPSAPARLRRTGRHE
ncbi:hypothetical protein ACIRU3_25530 [Streptomyces sp. NPDC101151]|uniref:hypothetical protein n=1 Tax=Streptomyces sp. NPDC101151 TaxID=3366115 RepID=UPI003812446D